MVERSFDRLPPMKNSLHYIEQYPERTKGLLGISYDQFIRLTAQAQLLEEQRQAESVQPPSSFLVSARSKILA
jgi:hypothetical protein